MMNLKNLIYSATAIVWTILFTQCGSKSDTLFEELSPEKSGVKFTNAVADTPEMNIFNYRNFYNGAGVAVGDINNDGLPDMYVVANQGPNKLYLNRSTPSTGGKGEVEIKFEDITEKAGVAGKRAFSTGAVMADVNGDGWLDIYVCNSGEKPGDDRANELFINKSPLTPGGGISFEEKAAEYGLDDRGYSTHASFFDYDRDGDLDMFLLENSSYPVNKLGFQNIRDQRDPLAGQKLFRNSPLTPGGGTHFEDVSDKAGIYGSLIGFGLGITIGDVNNDGWPDIYISNDFYERDYLYINQQNGTFKEESKTQMGHESLSSMGADVADINNDGHLDIFSTDMLPWDDHRLKTTMSYDDYNLTDLKLKNDFYYQFSRNMLQLNNGDGTFSEVGALAGVHATDWSWGALIFDMDTDGQKDLFVANGIFKNVTDQDFVQFLNDENTMAPFVSGQKRFDYKEFVAKIKEYAVPNYAFKNEGDLKFTNKATDWGLGNPSFSSGAAYGDLDNDGDLDLVVNNTNQPFQIFKNKSVEQTKVHFLRVKLKGTSSNTFGVGTRVLLSAGGQTQTLEQMPNRGFESSVDYTMVFGLGTQAQIDSLKVIWPDGKMQRINAPKIDSDLTLVQANAKEVFLPKSAILNQPFADLTVQTKLDFLHEENPFVDYNRDPLLKQMYSRLGPALAVGDVNADGFDDVFVGAGSGKAKKLFVQQTNGTFAEQSTGSLNFDAMAEVVAAQFFDADNDKDLDLLMVTGGNDFFFNDIALADYLYLNDGKGNFTKDIRFPAVFESGACVTTADFDNDGDVDVFVGGRLISSKYGFSAPQQL
ncbi:MAG: VCBS repeat-containing protein, partial [Spirosomaceae bacterium]|nr:VCBS repeat-containing protein [Spirosomataceae bacterium]